MDAQFAANDRNEVGERPASIDPDDIGALLSPPARAAPAASRRRGWFFAEPCAFRLTAGSRF